MIKNILRQPQVQYFPVFENTIVQSTQLDKLKMEVLKQNDIL